MVTAAAVELPKVYSPARAALIIAAGTVAVVLVVWPLFTGPPRGVDEPVADRGGVR
jgi:hypothetical protein